MTVNPLRAIFAAAFASFSVASFAQQQQPVTYIQDVCVKVQEGKGQDYQNYLRDISMKLAQVRVNTGRMQWWGVERAVTPVGASARCDYHIVSSYAGFPPGPMDPEQVAADYERAKLDPAEATRRREADSRLIAVDYWRLADRTGAEVKEGSYIRRNFYKIKPGHTMADWVKLETSGWMPLAAALAKERPGSAWAVLGMTISGGTRLPYQGMTVDIFPDWKSLGEGAPLDKLWSKVHPDLSSADYLKMVGDTVDRYSVEVYRMVHLIRNESGNQASRTIDK